jgi:hypothetical protein
MSVYLVTWDLNREKPNYASARAAFVANLERYEHTKDPGLDSVRFVSTTWDASQIQVDLRKFMDANDKLFVVRLNRDTGTGHEGWLNQTVWDWIKTRL